MLKDFLMKVSIFALSAVISIQGRNIFTLAGVKFIPIHRFMKKTMRVKNLIILLSAVVVLASCKNGGLFSKKKHDKSDVTG